MATGKVILVVVLQIQSAATVSRLVWRWLANGMTAKGYNMKCSAILATSFISLRMSDDAIGP